MVLLSESYAAVICSVINPLRDISSLAGKNLSNNLRFPANTININWLISFSEIEGVVASSESFLMASITSSKESSIDLIVVLTRHSQLGFGDFLFSKECW